MFPCVKNLAIHTSSNTGRLDAYTIKEALASCLNVWEVREQDESYRKHSFHAFLLPESYMIKGALASCFNALYSSLLLHKHRSTTARRRLWCLLEKCFRRLLPP